MPSTSISGLASASRIAIASSWPGSVSMMIAVGHDRAPASAVQRHRVLAAHQLLVVAGDRLGQRADLEAVGADRADRRHLGGGAGQPALLEVRHLVRLDVALVHPDAALLQHLQHRLPGDAVQEAVGLAACAPRRP